MSYDDIRRYRTDSLDDDKEVSHAKSRIAEITSNNRTIELNLTKAGDQLIKCSMCKHRKVPFMPGYFCDICIKLWFMLGDEAQRVALDLWHREKGRDTLHLTPLELERIHWLISNKDLASNHKPFTDFINKEKPELVPELDKYMYREVVQLR